MQPTLPTGAASDEHEPAQNRKGTRRFPWRGIAIAFGSVVASVAVLYLVAMNLFLCTGLFRNAISANPAAFRLEYTRAYSIVPGRIHVDGLTIRGRDSSIEWILGLDDCDFRIAFRDLLHKRFHAFHVRASGFAIRVRLRIQPTDATPELVAALPPIAGFADPPYAGAKAAPLTDANYNLWMIQLDDVDVQHVREVWIHTVRSQGDARVRGRWVFRPLRWLEVGPASVDVTTLDVATGSSPLATGLHGSVEATVHPFDLREPQGLEILEYVSTKTNVLGTAMIANVLTAVLPSCADHAPAGPTARPPRAAWSIVETCRRKEVRFVRAEGPVDIQLVADHGALASGTRVWAEAPDAEFTLERLVFDAAVRVELDVDGGGAYLRARGSDCSVSGSPGLQAKAASIDATLVSHHLDAAHAFFDDADFAVAIHRAGTDSLAAWQERYLPASGIAVRADRVTADCEVHGSVAQARAQGQLQFAAQRFAGARGADKVAGDVTGRVQLHDSGLADGVADLSGSQIALHDARVTWRGIDARAPIVNLQATRAFLPLLTAPQGSGGRAVGRRSADVDFDLVLPRADVGDLRQINALVPASAHSVTMAGRASVSARLLFSLSAQRASGFATVVGDDIAARVGPAIVEGKLVAHVALRRWEVADHAIELSGSDIVLRDVSIRSGIPAQQTADIVIVPSLTVLTSRLAIGPRGNDGTVSLDVPNAAIADLRTLAAVGALPQEVSVQGGELDASMHVDADLRSGAASGDARVVARELKARFGSTIATAGLTVEVRARRDASEASGAEPIDLSGSKVSITQGGIGEGQGSWRGNFELRDAILHTRDGVGFEAKVHGTATDASPAAALVADNAGVPAWAANMFRMPDLHVDGEVRATGTSLELRSLAAQGGGTSVRVEYAKRGTQQNGAMLMDLGWVELGYDLTAGSTGLVVLGSEGWFNRKSAMIRADTAPIEANAQRAVRQK